MLKKNVSEKHLQPQENNDEARYCALLELSQAVIWATDAEGLAITPQASWEAFTGQSWEEYKGKGMGWINVVHPDDREQLLQAWKKAITEHSPYEHIARFRHHSGNYYYMLVRGSPLFDKTGKVKEWVGLCLNIQNLKSTEQALRESEQQFRDLTNSLPQLVWTAKPNGEVEYCNLRCKEYTGFEQENLGWGWTNVVHPEDCYGILKHWEKCRITEQPFQYEVRMRRYDGSYRWHTNQAVPMRNQQGNIIRWFGTCTDIHELQETTKKLLATTECLNLTLKSSKLGVWNWDLTTDKVEVDDKVLELFQINKQSFQYTAQEVIAHIHESDRLRIQTELEQCIKTGKFYDAEFQIQNSNPPRFVAGRGDVYFNQQGQAYRIQGINWDVTPRKQLEAERLEALRKAQEEEHQRAQQAIEYRRKQEEFIDTICHEIRNPLNGIYGGADMSEDNLNTLHNLIKTEASKLQPEFTNKLYQALGEIQKNIKIIRQSAQQQKYIVDDVLDLSKLENGKIELNLVVFNIKEQVQLAIQMFALQIKQKNLAVNIKAEDKWIKADAHRFAQIMINLISNAVKFTHEGAITISIAIKQVSEADIDLFISVADTGIGMNAEETSRLFERFTQANHRTMSAYGGSGLGLVITKKLVEAMGGNIRVRSQKWHGTCFEVELKALVLSKQEQQQLNKSQLLNQPSDSAKTLPEAWRGNKRILIVEDNCVNQKILKILLEKHGYLCEVANNGAEAVEKYEKLNFDCIFMDIEMPVMNGLDATRQIRLKEKEQVLNQRTPIIGLSSNARKEHAQIALDTGMDDYVTKPFLPKVILEKVEQIKNKLCCATYKNKQPILVPACVIATKPPALPTKAAAKVHSSPKQVFHVASNSQC